MPSFTFSETLRIAQVGVGWWGTNLLRVFASLPGVQVVGLCDADEQALAAAARTVPRAATHHRFPEMLARDDVDAIVIATETQTHFEMAEAALASGRHVFVEKPLAQTVDQAERLVALAAEQDRRLMVGHLLRYHPAFRHVERLAADGALGEIRYVSSVRAGLGVVHSQENAFDSLAPLDLAAARALIASDPVAVSAQGQAFLRPGVEDVVFATVFYAGGEMAHLHTSWLDPHKVRRTTVVGSDKMAVIDDQEPAEKVRVYDRSVDLPQPEDGYVGFAEAVSVRSGDILVPRIAPDEPLRLEAQEFVSAIAERRAPLTDGLDGLAVVRLLEAARRSLAAGGTRVEL